MRFIIAAPAILILAVCTATAWLYLSDAALLSRYLSFFAPEDFSYAQLQPRKQVAGGSRYQLPIATPETRSINPDALKAMAHFAEEQNSHALIVIHQGVVQLEWYKAGWHRDSLTQSQSMHKSILPILIQAAVQEGKIDSLQDPVGRYIKEWKDDPRGAITLEQMLQMSSGLRVYPFSINPFSDAFQWLFASDTLPILLRTPLDREAGTTFEYNNVNSELLGLVIERATGLRYDQYLETVLWQPMGGNRAELWVDQEGGKLHTSCCLMAPAMDWARFGMLLLNEGMVNGQRIVDAQFIRRMVTPTPSFDWYGYQIWLGYSRESNPRAKLLAGGYQRTTPFIANDTYYTSGYGAQRVYVVPSEQLVVVRLGPASGRSPVKASWDNTFLINTAIKGMK